MKPNGLIRVAMASAMLLGLLTCGIYCFDIINKNKVVYALDGNEYISETVELDLNYKEVDSIKENKENVKKDIKNQNDEIIEEVVVLDRNEVFDGLTMEELTDKLNKTLSSDLSGTGSLFAKYSIELGVDPYLAVAIAMHETGCTWNCSSLMKQCNNVGGQKGTGCGEYQAFDSLDDGIYGFVLNIKKNYVDYGLLTADQMNPKYAEDPEWHNKVNKYIEKIKNN